ncbi:MAG: transcriptional regulator [Candidatus Eisenbacteria bacterium]|uniref:Transcriptional regulator n=1 Tax=Eiseniibacteriota bacterium TaxID=2212470 RepID=A0A948RWH8_UNCEI|nr:transcriptional regulator [Candidatus Eisenbacteria bacterium]MBU1951052.1 transcriptional regulator [Candidatus Eisenbacteria bacterium]MBU2691776.1 transcriptional regulator [Candidatus Eisenbacteria bacterium]
MSPEQFLLSHPVFTRTELRSALPEQSTATLDRTLTRWRRQGRIERVKRGLFVRLEHHREGTQVLPDFAVLASRMASDAAAAYHTALEVHGCAQSIFERFTFVTWTGVKTAHYRGRLLIPVRPRAQISANRGENWVDTLDRKGLELRVTNLERTAVDVLDRPELAGGIEEVWRSLAALPAIDPVALLKYVLLLDSARVAARVGFFLESRQADLAIPASTLEALQTRLPKQPVYMQRRLGGKLNRRWRLIVPDELNGPPEEAGV